MRYHVDQFNQDRKRLLQIVGNKLEYLSSDSNTFRVTVGDEELKIFVDVYLSKRTMVIRVGKRQPRYFRKRSWDQLTNLFSNLFNYINW